MKERISNRYIQCSRSLKYRIFLWWALLMSLAACDPCDPNGESTDDQLILTNISDGTSGSVIIFSEGNSDYDVVEPFIVDLPKQIFGRWFPYTYSAEELWVYSNGVKELWAFNPLGPDYAIGAALMPNPETAYFTNKDTSTVYVADSAGNLALLVSDRAIETGIMYSEELESLIYIDDSGSLRSINRDGSGIGSFALSSPAGSFILSPGGRFAAVLGEDKIYTIDLADNKILWETESLSVSVDALSVDGTKIYSINETLSSIIVIDDSGSQGTLYQSAEGTIESVYSKPNGDVAAIISDGQVKSALVALDGKSGIVLRLSISDALNAVFSE